MYKRQHVRIKGKATANSSIPDLHEMNITFDENEFNVNPARSIDETLLTNHIHSAIDQFDSTMLIFNEFAPMSTVWLVLGLVCCVLCALLMICTCCLCDRLRLAAGKKPSLIRFVASTFGRFSID